MLIIFLVFWFVCLLCLCSSCVPNVGSVFGLSICDCPVYLMLAVSSDCLFVIVPSVFSNVYLFRLVQVIQLSSGRRGRDRMVVGFTTI